MRSILWILLVASLTSVAFWIVVGPWFPRNRFELFFVVVFFAAPNLGTIWMLYVSVRSEKHPLPLVLLAFVPYAFLWYYFERVRRGKHLTRAAA